MTHEKQLTKFVLIILINFLTIHSNAQQKFPVGYLLTDSISLNFQYMNRLDNHLREFNLRENPGFTTNKYIVNKINNDLFSTTIDTVHYEFYQPKNNNSIDYIIVWTIHYNNETDVLEYLKSIDASNNKDELYVFNKNNIICIQYHLTDLKYEIINKIVFNYSENNSTYKIFSPIRDLNDEYIFYNHTSTTLYKEAVPGVAVANEMPSYNKHKSKIIKKDAARKKKKDNAINDLEDKAYAALDRDDFENAKRYFKQLIQKAPNDPDNSNAYYNLAFIYATTNEQLEAIKIAQTALKNQPASEYADFYKIIGNCYADIGNYDTGFVYLQKALQLKGNDVILLYNLGYIYFKKHQYDKAIYWFYRCLDGGYANKYNINDVMFYIGTSLSESGEHEVSISYYDKAIEYSEYYSYYFNKAEALIRLNKPNEALEVINDAISKYSDNAELFFKRHQIYNHLNNKIKSNNDLKTAYSLDSKDPDILLDMGVLYADNNEIDKAFITYQAALQNGIDADLVYTNIGNIYSTNPMRYDSAAYYYKKAIELNPEKAGYYFNYGNLFKKLKEYDNAITQYKKAIELNPMLIVAYNNLGLVYIIQSKYDTAKSILLEALEHAPDDYEINANLTSIAVKENNHLLIDSFATKALSLLPDEYDNLDLLDIRGNARLMLGRPQDALYDYLSILKQLSKEEEKNNASIFSNAAYCYIEMNHYDEAIQYFEKTLEYDKSVDAAIGLMITYYKLKDTKKLNDAKAKAYELEPLLKDGMKGIEKLEADGYFYTESQKDILKRILK